MKKVILVTLIIFFCPKSFSQEKENPNELIKYFLSSFELDKAFPHIEKLAKEGDGKSQYYLGFYYENGIIVKQDKNKALEYYNESIKNGFTLGYYRASRLMLEKEIQEGGSQKWYSNEDFRIKIYNSKANNLLKEGIEKDNFLASYYFFMQWLYANQSGTNELANEDIRKDFIKLLPYLAKQNTHNINKAHQLDFYYGIGMPIELRTINNANLSLAFAYYLNPEDVPSSIIFSIILKPSNFFEQEKIKNNLSKIESNLLNKLNSKFTEQDFVKSYTWFLIYNEEKRFFPNNIQVETIKIIQDIESRLTLEEKEKARLDAQSIIKSDLSNINKLYTVENTESKRNYLLSQFRNVSIKTNRNGYSKITLYNENGEVNSVTYFENEKIKSKREWKFENIYEYFYDLNGKETKKIIRDSKTFKITGTY